jgi:hypothetical protein
MAEVEQVQPKAVTEANEQPMIPAAPGKDVEELVTGVQKGLVGLVEMFNITPGITEDDKVKLAGIIKEYTELITENLGAAPGEPVKSEEPKKLVGQVSMEAGLAKVLPVP